MASFPHPLPEELLSRFAWLRDLARGLLADPGAAEDVAQEAWIAALAHPPLADRPLEPWLARVVRNLASKRRRGEARREHHERAALAREPVPGPEATAERLELQRTVLAAIEAIEEPFRTTVVQRYLEGRSSADIARALELPEGTVRWRLKRGLDELRARLDARFGGREAWCALLLPLAAPPGLAGPATGPLAPLTLPTGVLTMIAASKIALAAVLGVAAVGFVLWQSGDRQRAGSSEVAQAASPKAEEPRALLPVESAPEARVEPHEAPAARPEATKSAPALAPAQAAVAPPTAARLVMRFVDVQGAPWGEVAVLDLGSKDVRGTSGADGRVELLLKRDPPVKGEGKERADGSTEWTVQLLARRAGCATRELRVVTAPGRTTDLGDVLLEPGARIEGRVLDEAGVAIAGADVGFATSEPFRDEDEGLARRQGGPGFEQTTRVRSDPGGAFALDGVARGRWRLWGHAEGMRFGWTEPFEVVADTGLLRMDLRLPALLATDRITGIVLDPAGKPFPSARLTSTYELESESGTRSEDLGPDGRFEVVLEREAVYSFIATDPERRYSDAIAVDVAPGARDLKLRLSEKRTFEVSAKDRDGRAVEDCRFEVTMMVNGAHLSDPAAPERKAAGLYELALPAREFLLVIKADGYLPIRFDELRPETVGARLEVVFDTAPRLRGRVFADGAPVAGATVTLHKPTGELYYERNGFACVYEYGGLSEATADAEGRFDVTCTSTELVWLRASSPGWVAGELGPLDPLSSRELRVELTKGGAIEGRVLLPDGADAAGIVVGINHGDGHGRTLRAGPDGRFRFDHLMPGSWQVVRRDQELDPSSVSIMTTDDEHPEIEWSCTVEAGRTTHCDLDLTRP